MTGPVSARLGPEKRISTGWPGPIYHDIPGAVAGALFTQSAEVQAVAGTNCFTFGSRLMEWAAWESILSRHLISQNDTRTIILSLAG
jgi:hypothetical protein